MFTLAGPTMSMETGMRGRTQMPAHSGANSRGSRGIAASGIRVTLRGTTSMGGPPPLQGKDGPHPNSSHRLPSSALFLGSQEGLSGNSITCQADAVSL